MIFENTLILAIFYTSITKNKLERKTLEFIRPQKFQEYPKRLKIYTQLPTNKRYLLNLIS